MNLRAGVFLRGVDSLCMSLAFLIFPYGELSSKTLRISDGYGDGY